MTPEEIRAFTLMAEKIKMLEQCVSVLGQNQQQILQSGQVDKARIIALWTIARELAIHAGVQSAEFDRHFEARYQFWYDWILRKVEDTDPAQAARIDTRTAEEDSAVEQYPPLFPEQGEE